MRDTSGPAFPAGFEASDNDTMGLTIRDYFAAQALAQLIARLENESHATIESAAKECAEAAYVFADAMLKERDK